MSFHKCGFGIKSPTKVDMPLNSPKQTNDPPPKKKPDNSQEDLISMFDF